MTTDAAESKNLKLISHHDLGGFGNGGEGLALQATSEDVNLRRVIEQVLALVENQTRKGFIKTEIEFLEGELAVRRSSTIIASTISTTKNDENMSPLR